ncbi:hypothetical protein PMAYCL1PPCAC_12485, partial [Pristionchus mayeri]
SLITEEETLRTRQSSVHLIARAACAMVPSLSSTELHVCCCLDGTAVSFEKHRLQDISSVKIIMADRVAGIWKPSFLTTTSEEIVGIRELQKSYVVESWRRRLSTGLRSLPTHSENIPPSFAPFILSFLLLVSIKGGTDDGLGEGRSGSVPGASVGATRVSWLAGCRLAGDGRGGIAPPTHSRGDTGVYSREEREEEEETGSLHFNRVPMAEKAEEEKQPVTHLLN